MRQLAAVLLVSMLLSACGWESGFDQQGSPEPSAPGTVNWDGVTPQECASDAECAMENAPGSCELAICEAGLCATVAAPVGTVCDPGGLGECEVGICATDGCVSAAAPDGMPCALADWEPPTTIRTCMDGACGAATECLTDVDCAGQDDGDLCNGTVHCMERFCILNPASIVDCTDHAVGDCEVAVCDPETGMCLAEAGEDGLGCDDDDECTGDDLCTAGECVGGTVLCETVCDDEIDEDDDGMTDCDDDECEDLEICQGSECGDDECNGDETCETCPGDCGDCPDCPTVEGPGILGISAAALSEDCLATSGVDVDEDPATSSGQGDCDAGIDSQLSVVFGDPDFQALLPADFQQTLIDTALEVALGNLLVDFSDAPLDGSSFDLLLYFGVPTDPACDPQVQSCDYSVPLSMNFDALCNPDYGIVATVEGGDQLHAGSLDSDYTFETTFEEQPLIVNLHNVHIQGTLDITNPVTGFEGVIGAAAKKAELIDLLTLVGADNPSLIAVAEDLGTTPEALLGLAGALLDSALEADIDTDDDGEPDAVSFGGTLAAGPASVGVDCGDFVCSGDETCDTCPDDCGECLDVCPDEACTGSETCETCPDDCGACPVCDDNQSCDGDEDCASCPGDCGECMTSCDGFCGQPYTPGSDCQCNEACFLYENCCADVCDVCEAEFMNACNPPVCPDQKCNGDETCVSCEADCGPCGDPATLFFSEYIEGGSNNKAVEIHNFGDAAIDLEDCFINRYSNGDGVGEATIVEISPEGENLLAAGENWVLCNSSFQNPQLSDGTCQHVTSGLNHNGNDALELVCAGQPTDVFGKIGEDPGGDGWTGGDPLVSTKDMTLRRKCSVAAGDTDGTDAFDPSVEWLGYAKDTFDDLGAYVCL